MKSNDCSAQRSAMVEALSREKKRTPVNRQLLVKS